MTTMTVRNGIDVDRLTSTVEALGTDPQLGAFTFRAGTRWEDGTHNLGSIGRFTHAGSLDDSRTEAFRSEGDEPPVLLGENRGPNAVELVLQALGFCYAVGFIANAAARGIDVTSMEYEVEGDLDVRPFLGLDGPRPGFTDIRVVGRVSSPNATDEQLTDLCEYVQRTSPVRDVLVNTVPVRTSLEID